MDRAMRGVAFYEALTAENHAHYAGKGVKLDTPNRPIFWYKPSGAEKYRVIYADLAVRDVAIALVCPMPSPCRLRVNRRRNSEAISGQDSDDRHLTAR